MLSNKQKRNVGAMHWDSMKKRFTCTHNKKKTPAIDLGEKIY